MTDRPASAMDKSSENSFLQMKMLASGRGTEMQPLQNKCQAIEQESKCEKC